MLDKNSKARTNNSCLTEIESTFEMLLNQDYEYLFVPLDLIPIVFSSKQEQKKNYGKY
jgi:hypothetical protein